MKKTIRMAMMAAAMFMVVTSVAKAQGGGGGGGRGRGPNMMALLKDSLKVSDAVLAKADSISKSWAAVNAPLNEAARGGDATARPKLMENRTKMNDEIKALLTADQKMALEKLMPAPAPRPPFHV